jgi:hypothetical protein
VSLHRADLRFFNRFERFKDQLELTGATGACVEMLSHAIQHSVDWHAVKIPLSVLIKFIKAFWAAHFHFSRLLDLLQQPANLFGV